MTATPADYCPGTDCPRNTRSTSDLGAKFFGSALGTCVCGDVRIVKNGGKIYRHKIDPEVALEQLRYAADVAAAHVLSGDRV